MFDLARLNKFLAHEQGCLVRGPHFIPKECTCGLTKTLSEAWAEKHSQASDTWMPISSIPKSGAMFRVYYGYGQEAIVQYDKKKKRWTNFEGDVDYDADNEGLGSPTHWQPYYPPRTDV